MTSWRDRLLAELAPGLARVTAAADPDALLDDPAVARALAARGQALAVYADPIAFRVRWQALRRAWREGASGELVVAVRDPLEVPRSLPFDVVGHRCCRVVELRKADLFPAAPAPSVTALPVGELDVLEALLARARIDRAAAAGVSGSLDRARALADGIDELTRALPTEAAPHGAWVGVAARWGALQALRHREATPRWHEARFEALHDALEERFAAWMGRRYAGLASLAPDPPVMLHHVPRAMARAREGDGGRVALVVMDGMAFDQWEALRADPSVAAVATGASVGGAFAWVPSTTVYSRQALFAGEAPARIASSLSGTSGEPTLWARFWASQGVADEGVGYLRGLGQGPFGAVRALAADTRVVALGLVVDAIDQMMHGVTLGMAGLHDQVRHWARTGWLAELLHMLRGAGFEVFLTADHGNLEATGAGRVGDGALAEMRCERARVFSDVALRDRFAAQYPAARPWTSAGLPRDQHVLVAAGRRAFVAVGPPVIVHGGAALEEVVVPLVRFAR